MLSSRKTTVKQRRTVTDSAIDTIATPIPFNRPHSQNKTTTNRQVSLPVYYLQQNHPRSMLRTSVSTIAQVFNLVGSEVNWVLFSGSGRRSSRSVSRWLSTEQQQQVLVRKLCYLWEVLDRSGWNTPSRIQGERKWNLKSIKVSCDLIKQKRRTGWQNERPTFHHPWRW